MSLEMCSTWSTCSLQTPEEKWVWNLFIWICGGGECGLCLMYRWSEILYEYVRMWWVKVWRLHTVSEATVDPHRLSGSWIASCWSFFCFSIVCYAHQFILPIFIRLQSWLCLIKVRRGSDEAAAHAHKSRFQTVPSSLARLIIVRRCGSPGQPCSSTSPSGYQWLNVDGVSPFSYNINLILAPPDLEDYVNINDLLLHPCNQLMKTKWLLIPVCIPPGKNGVGDFKI